jgi:hypothetical protein
MHAVHIAYLIILAVAWTWGISQATYAVQRGLQWPPAWRMTAALWLLAKAAFLTYVGFFTWHDMPGHGAAVWIFAAIHAAAFIQWWNLPGAEKPVAEPPAPEWPPKGAPRV